MNSTNKGKNKTCVFENKLILPISQEWHKLNGGKPLEFNVEFEKKELVLRASFVDGSQSTDELGEFTNAR
jgi:hypothetical protein